MRNKPFYIFKESNLRVLVGFEMGANEIDEVFRVLVRGEEGVEWV